MYSEEINAWGGGQVLVYRKDKKTHKLEHQNGDGMAFDMETKPREKNNLNSRSGVVGTQYILYCESVTGSLFFLIQN